MEFGYSGEQQALRELAGRLLSGRFTDEYRKVFAREGRPYDATLWAALAEAGVLGTAIAPEHGGSGLGLTELGLLLEEQGRALAAVPILATLVLGALPLQRFGSPAQRALLKAVAAGEILLSAALEEEGGGEAQLCGTQAAPIAGGWQLSGVKTCVPHAAQAQYLIVSARSGQAAPRLFLIARDAPGLTLEPQRSTSGEPQARLRLEGVLAGSHDVIGAESEDAPGWLIAHAQVALAALQLGILGEALRRAALYVSERQQFGRPIGSFQAVQHRLADCCIDLEALRSAYLRAAWALDAGVPAAAEVLAAKWWAAQAGHRVAHAVQHVHGGLGADLDYPIHAYFLHAKQTEMTLGGASACLAGIGRLLAAGAAPALTGAQE